MDKSLSILTLLMRQFHLSSLADFVGDICEQLLALWICTLVLLAFVGKINVKKVLAQTAKVPVFLVLVLWHRELFVLGICLTVFGFIITYIWLIFKNPNVHKQPLIKSDSGFTLHPIRANTNATGFFATVILFIFVSKFRCSFFEVKQTDQSFISVTQEWLLLTAFQVIIIITILQFFTLAAVFLTLSVPHISFIILKNAVQRKDIAICYPTEKINTCTQTTIGEESSFNNTPRKAGSIQTDISLWQSFTKLPLMAAILASLNFSIFKLDFVTSIVSPSWQDIFDMIVYVAIGTAVTVLCYLCEFCERCLCGTIRDQKKQLSEMQKIAAVSQLKWVKYVILGTLWPVEMFLLRPLLYLMKQQKRFGLIMYVLWLKFKIQTLKPLMSKEKQIQEAGKALWYLEHMSDFLCMYCRDETPVYLQHYLTKLQEQLEETASLDIKLNSNQCNSAEVCGNRTVSSTHYPCSISNYSYSKALDHKPVDSSESDESENKDGTVAHPPSAESSSLDNFTVSLNGEATICGDQNVGTLNEIVTEESVFRSFSEKIHVFRKRKRKRISKKQENDKDCDSESDDDVCKCKQQRENANYCDSTSNMSDLSLSTNSSKLNESDER